LPIVSIRCVIFQIVPIRFMVHFDTNSLDRCVIRRIDSNLHLLIVGSSLSLSSV